MYQVVVIGGGASGLAAAAAAGESGAKAVAVIEKLPRTGKKLLATGGGRCNLSHRGITEKDYTGSYHPGEILARFGEAEAFFWEMGLYCRTDAEGRVYPYSLRAESVVDALRLRIKQLGIQEYCGQEVCALEREGEHWKVTTPQRQFLAEKVIFAAGGCAAPKFGTDGSAWRLLEKLGIRMTPPRPILCPVLTDGVRPLKGLRMKGKVTLLERERPVREEQGEVQFTETALSGICVFNLSARIAGRGEYTILADFLPEVSEEETIAQLGHVARVRAGERAENLFTGFLPRPLVNVLLGRAGIPAAKRTLETANLCRLSREMHRTRFPVKGLGSFEQAQATAGGVQGNELDSCLQVRRQPGLYVTGEAVDVQSLCGGYHLHWCWASGAAAGKAAAFHLSSKRKNP